MVPVVEPGIPTRCRGVAYFSRTGVGNSAMSMTAAPGLGPRPSSALAGAVQDADALAVAGQVFDDFSLNGPELQRVAEVLWMMSGGPEYQRIVDRARKKSSAPWDSLTTYQRTEKIKSAMAFHCSSADMERMALRTGAGLLLLGETDLGRKIVENAPASQFGVKPQGIGIWLRIGQLCLYIFMLSLIAIQSAVTGVYVFLIPGLAVFAVGLFMVWLLEHNKWKLEHEQREAKSYLLALSRVGQGVPLNQLFEPDGSLRTAPG
jgi:hypothetical protein